MKNMEGKGELKNILVVLAIALIVFEPNGAFAQSGASSLVTKVGSALDDAWGLVKIIAFFGVVVCALVGCITAYSKVGGAQPSEFIAAAKGWFTGVIFIILAFAVIGGLKVVFDYMAGTMSFSK